MCRAFHESQAEAELKDQAPSSHLLCTVRNDGNAKGNRFLRLDFNNAAHKVSTPDALLVIFKRTVLSLGRSFTRTGSPASFTASLKESVAPVGM